MLVGPRAEGGFEGELDIVAFNPKEKHLVHIEPSMDASSWAEREERYQKKFVIGRKYIPQLFQGIDLPKEIEQIAVLVFASKAKHSTLGGGRLMLIDEFLRKIFHELKDKHLASNAIPEHLTVFRSFQFVAEYFRVISTALKVAG